MKKLLLALLAVVIVLALADVVYAQGRGGGGRGGQGGGKGPGGNPPQPPPADPGAGPGAGPKGDPKGDPSGGADPKGDGRHREVDPDVVSVVRNLRKLMWTLREMINADADPGKIERIEEQIRKLIGWLEEHDVKWREMNNREKCDLDPEVGKMIRAMEWLRNELKGLDPEKDKAKIARIMRKMEQIMKALRKKHVGDGDLPDDLKPKKGEEGRKEAENGKGKGDCDRERKRDGSCGDCPKGDGDCPKGDGCQKHDGPCDCPKGDCDRERKRDGSGDGCPKGDGGGSK